MAKTKRTPEFQYGVELTKPWSNEMYSHNDQVRNEAQKVLNEMIDNGPVFVNGTDIRTEDTLTKETVADLKYWQLNKLQKELNLPLTVGFVGYN